jgi:DNA topoisomerase IA
MSIFFKLYTMWQEVDADLEYAGLGMPSTFADHISRINSRSQVVRDTEKAWFEALVKSTHE